MCPIFYVDGIWHEYELTIELLREGKLSRDELRRRIRSRQELLLGCSHSDSTYNNWIRQLKKQGIIEEYNKELRLTELGSWLPSSNLGSLFERVSFLDRFVCKKCSSHLNIVLFTPLLDTVDKNSINIRGEIWVDLKCPRCGTLSPQNHLPSKDELVGFYNQAIVELSQYVNVEGQTI